MLPWWGGPAWGGRCLPVWETILGVGDRCPGVSPRLQAETSCGRGRSPQPGPPVVGDPLRGSRSVVRPGVA